MAEEDLVCAKCGGEVKKDLHYAGTYWCEGECKSVVPVKIKEKPPCPFCRGTGKRGTGPGYHDVEEFYKEDPKPMKCPNCTEPLEGESINVHPVWVILGEIPHGEEAMYHRGTDVRTLHKCPHCHCIVLRCEE